MADWVQSGSRNINNAGHSGKPGFRLFVKFPVNNIYFTYKSTSIALSLPGGTPLYAKKVLSNQKIGNLYGTFGIGQNHGQSPGFSIYKLYDSLSIKLPEEEIEYPPTKMYGDLEKREIDSIIDNVIQEEMNKLVGYNNNKNVNNSNNSNINNNLFMAIKKLNLKNVVRILDKGADPNIRLGLFNAIDTLVNTPFDQSKSIPILKLLIERGADIYQSLYTICINIKEEDENYDYFQVVLDINLDPYTYKIDNNGHNVNLIEACYAVADRYVVKMFQDKYNINNYVNSKGNNLMHIIVMNNEMFNFDKFNGKVSQLNHNPEINFYHKNNDGKTPYDIAIEKFKNHRFTELDDYEGYNSLRHYIRSFKKMFLNPTQPNVFGQESNNNSNQSENQTGGIKKWKWNNKLYVINNDVKGKYIMVKRKKKYI